MEGKKLILSLVVRAFKFCIFRETELEEEEGMTVVRKVVDYVGCFFKVASRVGVESDL